MDTTTTIDSSWLRVLRPAAGARLRLFCFPYAGAGPAVYKPWAALLPPTIELVGIHYPGREARAGEPPLTDFRQLVGRLHDALPPFLDMPFAFFGHSMGAYVAFELSKALDVHGLAPEHLFLSGAGAPHLPERAPIHGLPSRAFLTEVIRLNGIPKEVMASAELLAYLLPILRADFTACERYSADHARPLNCPLSVFGGTRDPRVSGERIAAWRDYAGLSISVDMFDGDHFFLNEHRSVLLGKIIRQLGIHLS